MIMKRIIALLLAWMLAISCMAAFAEEKAAAEWKLDITVTDTDGNPIADADVTVRNDAKKTVLTARTDGKGTASAALPEGLYTVRASADGYNAQEAIDLNEDMALALTIRTLTPGSHVTVGTLSKVTGSFSTDLFSNNTSDIDVRAMLHGYSTVGFTGESTYEVDDSVVTLRSASSDDLDNKLFIFDVAEGLCYNDGTPITARDYVFSILMQASAAMKELGAQTTGYWQVLGFDEYNAGDRNYISGLRLLDDRSFSINIRTDALPYYYEMMLVNVTPYPISVIAPGCDVADDGRGAYITGEFTAEVLRKTMLDPETGYVSHPKVTSGPYQLESYDAAAGTVVMKANPNYRGNVDGQRPLIETVTLVETTVSDALAQLQDGTLDIVNKMTDSQVVEAGLALVHGGTLQTANYLRSGLGFLSFACEQGPTMVNNVRKAISYCLDQDALVTAYTGVYGRAVYSWYGLGQWMVTNYVNDMDQYTTTYPIDLKAAEALLQRSGFIYNEKGEAYNPETDTVRYRLLQGNTLNNYNETKDPVVKAVKVGNKNLLPLQLRFAKVENNRMCEVLEELLFPNLREVGFDVAVEEMSYEEMLAQYYRDTTRTCNAFALATNFNFVFDPVNTWRNEPAYQGHVNTTGLDDNELYVVARTLRNTQPGDTETYTKRWLNLMRLYSEKLPAIPLYSNMYFDFFGNKVQGYQPNGNWSWSAAVLYTWVDDNAATTTDMP